VAAFLANERPAVEWPSAAASAPSVRAPARAIVPVSISLSQPTGKVETAALTRGGHARGIGRAGRVAVKVTVASSDAGFAASSRARP
jgi:hypothetical protein